MLSVKKDAIENFNITEDESDHEISENAFIR